MAETEIEYPLRPKFYANKVTRLLFKTATANDLGSDVCYLVTQIAHQEDASRYAGPVTFWNEQLMAICGFKNVRALDRARASAVKAGWLMYLHGGKGKVGKYFTLIPQKYISYEDGAIDETQVKAELETGTQVTEPDATNPPEKRQRNARETPDNSQRNAEQTPEKCLTFLPCPLPLGDTYTGENDQKTFRDLEGSNQAFLLIPDPEFDRVLDIREDELRWQWLFICWWNSLKGVLKYDHSRLDSFSEKELFRRLCERDWDWRTAGMSFPVNYEQPALGWFLGEGVLQRVANGVFKPRDFTKPKGKKNDRKGPDNSASTFKSDKKQSADDSWGEAEGR